MAATLPAWIQAAGITFTVLAAAWGAYHRYVVVPARQQAEAAMSKARKADSKAESTRGQVDSLDDDLRDSLSELSESVGELVEAVEKQQRESRGRSYQLYVLAEAMNEADEVPDVPVPDEEEFLRGGGEFRGRGDD